MDAVPPRLPKQNNNQDASGAIDGPVIIAAMCCPTKQVSCCKQGEIVRAAGGIPIGWRRKASRVSSRAWQNDTANTTSGTSSRARSCTQEFYLAMHISSILDIARHALKVF